MNTEEFKVKGKDLLNKIKEIIHEGNIRNITVKDESGKVLVKLPLTLGVIGALIAPMIIAVGTVGLLIGNYIITVERKEEKKDNEADNKQKNDEPDNKK